MLLNKFYSVVEVSDSPASVEAVIRFENNHPIFEGHFPGNPVVPGVCMIQIVRELLEQKFKHKLMLHDGDNIKFLAVINPNDTPLVNATIAVQFTQDVFDVQASLTVGEVTYFKFKGSFRRA